MGLYVALAGLERLEGHCDEPGCSLCRDAVGMSYTLRMYLACLQGESILTDRLLERLPRELAPLAGTPTADDELGLVEMLRRHRVRREEADYATFAR